MALPGADLVAAPARQPEPLDEAEQWRLLMPDLLGVARGKFLRGADLDKGLSLAAAVYLIGHDVQPLPMPGLSDAEGYPDVTVRAEPDTARVSWNPAERIVLGSSYGRDGRPFRLDPRHALRRVVAAWEAIGLRPRIAVELEFFVLEDDGAGGWRAPSIPAARPYGTGCDVDPLGVGRRVFDAAQRAGISLEGMSSEFFPGQFEVNLAPQDACATCDDIFVLRLLVREVVHEMGLKATFMPRPFNDRGGNGLHVNISFVDRAGDNALDDPDGSDGLAASAPQMIAGMLAHHRSMCALLAPTVNSYKRLRPGLLCGYYADWGHDNRHVTVRVPVARGAGTRLEARQADASGCPHLVVATLLAAALDGVRRELAAPAPRTGQGLDGSAVAVPGSLGEAIELLADARPECLEQLLGADLLEAFIRLKRHEWRRFTEHVTDWELDEYLPHH